MVQKVYKHQSYFSRITDFYPNGQLQDSLRWVPTEDRKDLVLWPAYKDNDVALTRAAAEKSSKKRNENIDDCSMSE